MDRMFKLTISTIIVLFTTFILGLIRAMIDVGKIKTMSSEILYFHIVFASITGILSIFLFSLARKTGLLFPKALATINLSAISTAGFSGLMYLWSNKHIFSLSMLYSFEIAFGVSSMLIGYLYCFYKICFR
ncbi:conserved hypothetical protein [Sulfolobus islandicus L.S.2.15]|uniref:Uncharacterized protein n=2 Tax=Saccharolobus islandicus TaxID=43080 RepID=C3MNQ9_SACI2|nr:hypothetical protein [Sulfolobus islandicus]ACP35022.1 conserved hypothetical protein [Sulfolobus islandicus L.S.2.15]ADB86407.1 conserved hypothetical protein [Sulfolobus islandicus L.D.8.5]